MEEAAKRYARRILLLHLVALSFVVGLVLLASLEVYNRTRAQIVDQARARQELLARQTASAIDSYYASIVSDLNLFRRSEESSSAGGPSSAPSAATTEISPVLTGPRGSFVPPRLLKPLWNQLDGRASHLLLLHRSSLSILHAFPESPDHDADRETARQLIAPFAPWLRTLDRPAVSPFQVTRGGGANLIAVPVGPTFILAALVPVSNVERHFLSIVSRDRDMQAALLEEKGVVMATSSVHNLAYEPVTLPAASSTRPAHRVLRRLDMVSLKPGTTEYWEPTPIAHGRVVLPPRMTTVETVDAEGQTLYVVITSRLAEITAAVNTMFARAFVGAVFVILAVTAILLSTALRLIRSRRSLETVRHEMLRKELDQARQIQLNWLPDPRASLPSSLRVAAVNQPASHISGDFYDWFTLPDGRTVLTIGDVTGHGMSAAFLMATTQLLVRTTMPRLLDPGACLAEINRQLCSQSFNGQFVTILILLLDPENSSLSLATAGHMPPLLSVDGAPFQPLPLEPQLVLGVDPHAAYPAESFPLDPNSRLLLYTDGLLDAQSPSGDRFRLPRLLSTLSAPAPDPAATPDSLLDTILASVQSFRSSRPLSDDLTLVSLSFSPSASLVSAK